MLKHNNSMCTMSQILFALVVIFTSCLIIATLEAYSESKSHVICCEETLTTHNRATKMRYVILKQCSNGKDDTISVTPSPYYN